MPQAGLGKGILNQLPRLGKARLGKAQLNCNKKFKCCPNLQIFSQGPLKFSSADKGYDTMVSDDSLFPPQIKKKEKLVRNFVINFMKGEEEIFSALMRAN